MNAPGALRGRVEPGLSSSPRRREPRLWRDEDIKFKVRRRGVCDRPHTGVGGMAERPR